MGSPALRWLATRKVIRNSGAVKPSAPHSSTVIIFYHIKYKGHYFCSQNTLFFSHFKHIIGLHFPPPLTFGMFSFDKWTMRGSDVSLPSRSFKSQCTIPYVCLSSSYCDCESTDPEEASSCLGDAVTLASTGSFLNSIGYLGEEEIQKHGDVGIAVMMAEHRLS